jgi:hypothetical protein
MENSDTLGVLRQLERGEISATEADARLNAPSVERIETPPFDKSELPYWVRMAWSIPLIVGTLIVVFGTWIIAATVRANILWFLLGIPIVLLGSLVIIIGASAFSGHWLYVNVEESRKNRHPVRFAIPFPIGLLRLALWIVPWVSKMSNSNLKFNRGRFNLNGDWDDPAELIAALERELREGRGITVDVDEPGERVQVYIV